MNKDLEPALQQHLTLVTDADLEWRETKRTAKARALLRAEQEIADALKARDRTVRAAVDAGLPLVELRRKHQGLHTSNQSTVLDSLRRTETDMLGLAA